MISVHEQATGSGLSIGWLTLAASQSLNALTLDMAVTARTALAAWADRDDIACVVLQGEGRAFCAGGDVRRMRTGILAGDSYCAQFFEQEYRLDYTIHRYPKPVLVWGHGVVMGGGLGLLAGASHRVVTGSTRCAMPETSIGLYPDVGASYFLNRLPPGLGLFLGITGCEWNGTDAVALGLADHLLDDSAREALPTSLTDAHWTTDTDANRACLSRLLQGLPVPACQPQLAPHIPTLASACNTSLAQATAKLQQLDISEPWYQRALDNLDRGCPVTARIVEEQLQRGRSLSLADAFRMEWNISLQCCQRPDFPEGVRAQLIDKDKQPRWRFSSIADVPDEYIAAHFTQPATRHPLADLD